MMFITGDISNGRSIDYHLSLMAKRIKCPIYFVLGNHDYHFSSIAEVHRKVRKVCKEYPNLVWVRDAGTVHLSDEVALIGSEGWYDAVEGRKSYLQYTFDWMLTAEFRRLPNLDARVERWRSMALESAVELVSKVHYAWKEGRKTIYLLTHVPPWKEATRDEGTVMENFWLPYNTNITLGRALEETMLGHNKRHLTVLAGHTHTDAWVHVSRNIECKVNKAKYYGMLSEEEKIFI